MLLGLEYITIEQLRLAFPDGPPQGGRLGELLVERGVISREQLAHASAVRAGVGLFEPGTPIDSTVTELIDARTVRRYQAVPVRIDPDGRLVVAMADPSNVLALDDLRIITGREIRPMLAPPDEITHLLGETRRLDSVLAGVDEGTSFADVRVTDYMVDDGDASNDDAPVVRLVNSILARGVDEGASDVHFEPQASEMVVRFRVDGVLRNVTTVPSRFSHGIASRIKIMADLDIAERRAPQDGRVGLYVTGRNLDLRVATLPTVYGEKIVIRILDRTNLVMDLRDLGFTNQVLEQFESIYRRPHGALLVTGPTGSGKSTTLYGTLNQLNSVEQNIITVEDPVEYRLPGINQVQVNPKAGLTFAAGLRSILRCDPDVIMIGEVRDPETAKIAIESALTGHLVLATLHTNDSAGALSRLTEMGVEGFLTASAVAGILAQRLARRLCVVLPRAPSAADLGVLGPRRPDAPAAGAGRHRAGLPAGRVRALRRIRLQGPAGGLRAPGRQRGDRRHDRHRRLGRRHHPSGPARGHAHAARGRAGQGAARGHEPGRTGEGGRLMPSVHHGARVRGRRTQREGRAMMEFSEMITTVVTSGASDLHLAVGAPPVMRVSGELKAIGREVLTPQDTRELLYGILTQDQRRRLETDLELDFSYQAPGLARFRVNAYHQRGVLGAALRVVPTTIRSLAGAQDPRDGRGVVDDSARPGAGYRRDRLRQVDDPRRADRPDQRDPLGPHHDHRGPDRVPAQPQALADQPARAGRRHAVVRQRPAQRAASGPRRDPGR